MAPGVALRSVVTPITASVGVLVTASATPHAKGAWVDLITAAANVYGGDLLSLVATDVGISATLTSLALDIGIGAAGSEVTVIEGVLVGGAWTTVTANVGAQHRVLPLYVPPGVRVAIRCQALIVSDTVRVIAHLMGGSPWGDPAIAPSKWETYGFAAASTSGITPTDGAANVKGAWLQVVASTTREHRHLMLSAQMVDTTLVAANKFVDIGVGAAASEVVVVPDTHFQCGGSEQVMGPYPAYYPIVRPIPSGSRLSIRSQSATNADPNLTYVVHAY